MPLTFPCSTAADSSTPRRFARALRALFAAAVLTARTTEAHAQSPEPSLHADKPLQAAQAARDPVAPRLGFSVALGLGQWALGGGNVAVQGRIGRLALEYSHGQGVHLSELSLLMNSSEKAVGADVYEPWTTGFGAGLIVAENRWMDLRILVEAKANHYNVRGGDRNTELDYTTFTVGPGVFYEIRIWRGLFLQPSLRWWPTVASTFKDGSTLLRANGTSVTMDRHESGVVPEREPRLGALTTHWPRSAPKRCVGTRTRAPTQSEGGPYLAGTANESSRVANACIRVILVVRDSKHAIGDVGGANCESS